MVRRRTRTLKMPSTVNKVGEVVENGVADASEKKTLHDDHYHASPTRTACKIDKEIMDAAKAAAASVVPFMEKAPMYIKSGRKPCGKSKAERAATAGRTIGVPLATRSQTKTIDNFFKANTASKNGRLKEIEEEKTVKAKEDALKSVHSTNSGLKVIDETGDQPSQISTSQLQNGTQKQPNIFFDLSDDTNETDNTELSDEIVSVSGNFPPYNSHSPGSTSTDNIFLQEPVLTLNVDKSPNQASSVVINKLLKIEPTFSSPSTFTTVTFNGRFNQIVSLNGSLSKHDLFNFESKPINKHVLSQENDSSSCDSGVVFVTSLKSGNSSLDVNRKPTTPHRIVCPSPIKTTPRIVPSVRATGISPSGRKITASKEHLSPRKSQRNIAIASLKTRRRLIHKDEAPCPSITNSTDVTTQRSCKQNDFIDDEFLDDDTNISDDHNEHEFENGFYDKSSAFYEASIGLAATTKTCPTVQQKIAVDLNKSHLKSKLKAQQTKMKHQAPQPLGATNGNRELTEFFPVRRSARKTKSAVKEEMMRNLEQAVLEERAEGLKVALFEGKGRGIVADRRFQRGEFVVEYVGDLISMAEAAEREKRYSLDENAGCYMYYFKHKNQQYCIDATVDTGKLGRLVNHSRNGNLITKVVVVKQRPHLILIAKDDIEPGEELTYDYGDRSKLSLLHHPWLAF